MVDRRLRGMIDSTERKKKEKENASIGILP
jgi:hypothetical protein